MVMDSLATVFKTNTHTILKVLLKWQSVVATLQYELVLLDEHNFD